MNEDFSIRLTPVRIALVLFATTAFLMLPAWVLGFPLGHDAVTHLHRLSGFSSQFWAGEAYPRWLINANGGLGSPTFFAYGPVIYMISTLSAPLVSWAQHGIPGGLELVLPTTIGLFLSGIGAYLWLCRITRPAPALAGALVYMAAAYHVAVDFYIRTALAEYWAMTWIPFLLYFAHRLEDKGRRACAGLAVGYAFLLGTHLVSALMFTPLLGFYVLFVTGKGKKLQSCIRLLAAVLLGSGVAGAYLLTALEHRVHMSVTEFLGNPHNRPENNFLYLDGRLFSQVSGIAAVQWFLSWLMLLTIITVFLAGVIAWRAKSAQIRRHAVFWLCAGIVAVVMMVEISGPIWAVIQPLQTIQFPWRFLTILTLSLASLTSLALSSARRPLTAWQGTMLLIMVLLLAGGILAPMGRIWLRYPRLTDWHATVINVRFEDLNRSWARWIPSEYLDVSRMGELANRTSKASLSRSSDSAIVEIWQPRNIRIQTNSEREDILTIGQLYYPGWKARSNDRQLSVTPSPEGLVQVDVPPGSHSIYIWLDGGTMESIGPYVSTLSLLSVLILALRRPAAPARTQSCANGGRTG